jgi:hypothetical protein
MLVSQIGAFQAVSTKEKEPWNKRRVHAQNMPPNTRNLTENDIVKARSPFLHTGPEEGHSGGHPPAQLCGFGWDHGLALHVDGTMGSLVEDVTSLVAT